jgi:hypothetical protein
LQDLFVDNKVPTFLRWQTPVLIDQEGDVLWVIGIQASEKVRIKKYRGKILEIQKKEQKN